MRMTDARRPQDLVTCPWVAMHRSTARKRVAAGHLPILSLSTAQVKRLEAQGADSNPGPESGGPGSGEWRPPDGDPGLSCIHKGGGLKAGIGLGCPLCISHPGWNSYRNSCTMETNEGRCGQAAEPGSGHARSLQGDPPCPYTQASIRPHIPTRAWERGERGTVSRHPPPSRELNTAGVLPKEPR